MTASSATGDSATPESSESRRLGSPVYPGGDSSAECSHAGLSPRPLDEVATVQGCRVGLSPWQVHGMGEASVGALAWGGRSSGPTACPVFAPLLLS